MSPFAIFLKRLRLSRSYKQKALANHLGYEQSYLSALERSEKGPPRQDFIKRLIEGLNLNEEEQGKLAQALAASRRQISIPARASEEEYALFRKLGSQLGNLRPLQIQLMELALEISEGNLVTGHTNSSCCPVLTSSRKEG
jgi:transcriptional regulator with XRE-family HTH domain